MMPIFDIARPIVVADIVPSSNHCQWPVCVYATDWIIDKVMYVIKFNIYSDIANEACEVTHVPFMNLSSTFRGMLCENVRGCVTMTLFGFRWYYKFILWFFLINHKQIINNLKSF